MNCASTLLALHIEIDLHRSTTAHERHIARTRIHNELAYLRSLPSSWSPVKWTLRMFEVIVSRTGLSLATAEESDFNVRSDNPFNGNNHNGNSITVNNDNSNQGT